MFSDKALWFIVGLFTGSLVGFFTSSLLVAAGLEERREDKVKFESDVSIRTDRNEIK